MFVFRQRPLVRSDAAEEEEVRRFNTKSNNNYGERIHWFMYRVKPEVNSEFFLLINSETTTRPWRMLVIRYFCIGSERS